MAKSREVDAEKMARNTEQLKDLPVGTLVTIQNQSGRYPTKWDKTGVVVEVRPHEQIVVRVDGSRRLKLRNRRYVLELDPKKTSLEDQHLMTSTNQAPALIPRKMRTRQTAPATWTPPPTSPTTSPQTPSHEPMLSPPSVPLPTKTGHKTPAPVNQLQPRSTTEIPVDLANSDQDRDQGVNSQGQDGGAGDARVRDGGLSEVCRHEDTAERPVRPRNMRYSANDYDLSSIQTRSRRTIRRAM